MGRRLIGVWAGLVVALLAMASATAAEESSPGGSVALELQGTHGYSLLILAGVRPGESEGQAVVFVDKPHSHVVYGVPAKLTPSSLEADLGPVGRIAMQLVPSGFKKTARSSCDERPVPYEAATWVGEFEFHGEEGFASASATSLPYTITPLLNVLCSESVEGHSGGDDVVGAGLNIGSQGRGPYLKLLARTNGPRSRSKCAPRSTNVRGSFG